MMINGTVSNIGETNGFFRIQVDSDRRWFGLGKNKPNFLQGDVVSFSVKQNDKGFWNVDGKVERVVEGPTKTTVQKDTTTMSYTTVEPAKTTGTDWAKKDKIIQKQSCRNSAIEVVRILLDKECLKLPAEKKRYDFVLALVDDLTEKYELANDGKVKEETPDVVITSGSEEETTTSGEKWE